MGRWEPIWIASLEISPRIEQKIQLKHGVDGEILRKYFVGGNRVSGGRIFDYENGARTWAFTPFETGRFFMTSHIPYIRR